MKNQDMSNQLPAKAAAAAGMIAGHKLYVTFAQLCKMLEACQ